MFAIVMLTALSMEDASRTATSDAREHRNQGTNYKHTDNGEWINLNRKKQGEKQEKNSEKKRQHTGVPGRRTRETQNGDFQCERTERKRGRDT